MGGGFEFVVVVKVGGVEVVGERRDDGGGEGADSSPVDALVSEERVGLDVLAVHLAQPIGGLAEELLDEVPRLSAERHLSRCFFHDLGEGDLMVDDLVVRLPLCLRTERRVANEHFKHDHSH